MCHENWSLTERTCRPPWTRPPRAPRLSRSRTVRRPSRPSRPLSGAACMRRAVSSQVPEGASPAPRLAVQLDDLRARHERGTHLCATHHQGGADGEVGATIACALPKNQDRRTRNRPPRSPSCRRPRGRCDRHTSADCYVPLLAKAKPPSPRPRPLHPARPRRLRPLPRTPATSPSGRPPRPGPPRTRSSRLASASTAAEVAVPMPPAAPNTPTRSIT